MSHAEGVQQCINTLMVALNCCAWPMQLYEARQNLQRRNRHGLFSSLRDAVLEPNEEPAAALGPQPTRRFSGAVQALISGTRDGDSSSSISIELRMSSDVSSAGVLQSSQ
jgi:hypothetical protein